MKQQTTTEGRLKPQSKLESLGLVAGVLGLTALAFGLVILLIDPGASPLLMLNLALGLFGLLLYALVFRKTLVSKLLGRSSSFLGLEFIRLLGLLLVFVGVNIYAAQSHLEWDFTRDGLFSLHPQSIQTAEALEETVHIYGFYRPQAPARGLLKEAVGLYQQYTSKIELHFINPDAPDPALVERFGLNSESLKVVVLGQNGVFSKLESPNEGAITQALIRVSVKEAPAVYVLEGHREPQIDDLKTEEGLGQVAQALRNQGYKVAPLRLFAEPSIPSDARLIIVLAGEDPLFDEEEARLKRFLDAGHSVMILLEPGRESGLTPLLSAYGIKADPSLVLEPQKAAKAYGFGPDAPIIARFEPHPITVPLKNTAVLFYRSRSLEPIIGLAGVQVMSLLQTGPTSWGELGAASEDPKARDEADLPGPLPVAMVSVKPKALGEEGRDSRLVVFGDMHFPNNRFRLIGSNQDLFLNTVNWLVGEEHKIAIRPKPRYADRLGLTEAQHYGIMFFALNLLPLSIIALGGAVWAVRRRK